MFRIPECFLSFEQPLSNQDSEAFLGSRRKTQSVWENAPTGCFRQEIVLFCCGKCKNYCISCPRSRVAHTQGNIALFAAHTRCLLGRELHSTSKQLVILQVGAPAQATQFVLFLLSLRTMRRRLRLPINHSEFPLATVTCILQGHSGAGEVPHHHDVLLPRSYGHHARLRHHQRQNIRQHHQVAAEHRRGACHCCFSCLSCQIP